MEFDKSRVHTALNADELRAGDKVIVADNLVDLKQFVIDQAVDELYEVDDESSEYRFIVGDGIGIVRYALAYLVERKENCTNCSTHCLGKSWLADKYTRCESYKPPVANDKENCTTCANKFTCARQATPNPEQTICLDYKAFRCSDYEPKAEPKTEPHYRPFKDTDELIKVWCEKGGKWQKRELTMPLIWVQSQDTGIKCLITEYADSFIVIDDVTYDMRSLLENLTFLDGSPCGVEE